ncbi:ribonuclease J [Mycoplasma sp. 2045]|uniref:ribonuclease J n=1 Tax=unclassified Mycoplasma TaxID=2683645 RepID=UPI00211CBC14|nr:ribonuclease J [Mycoplasma sp. 2045]UUM20488.1 ribonuclease J [Mycoplasma sp. 2045]
MENVNIFALGGQDENGKNCYVFEYNDDIFIVNAGAKVPLNMSNGVNTLIPNFDYLIKNKDRIKGLFITDIKNETFSAIPWLLMKIPNLKIYTSAFNQVLVIDRITKYDIQLKKGQVQVIRQKLQFGDLTIVPFGLTGSMPGNIGFNFQTKTGDYLFMFNYVEGNLGIYGKVYFPLLAKYFEGRKIVAIVSDAGKSNVSGRGIEKYNAYTELDDIFKKANPDEKIIVGAYGEEMVTLQQVLDLAIKYNRPVVPYGKTYADLLDLISKFSTVVPLPKLIDHRQINKHSNAIVLITASTERLYSRFNRITENNDVYLKIKPSDTVIMLAPPVNGLESDYAQTMDEIAKITHNLFDISEKMFFYVRPTRDDLVSLVKVLKPDVFMPAQGLYRYLVSASDYINDELKNVQDINTLVLMNGKIAHFIDGKLFSHNGKVKEVGTTIIDGFGVGDISSEVISEREFLGREGVIVINIMYDSKTRNLTGQLHINYVGVIDISEQEQMTNLIKQIVVDVVKSNSCKRMYDLNEKLRKTIRKKIFKATDKDPMIALSLLAV